MAGEAKLVGVWRSHPWVVALSGGVLYRGKYMDPALAEAAAARVEAGESPADVFGWAGGKLPADSIRSVEWVPAANTVLVRRGWWRDPWRLSPPEGETAFQAIAALQPFAVESRSRVGPGDLEMDPALALGVLLAFFGLIALVGGALEGVGAAPVPVAAWVVAELGQKLGLTAVLALGMIAFLGGTAALVRWYVRRPSKVVVRSGR
jgi:hypothetical protein